MKLYNMKRGHIINQHIVHLLIGGLLIGASLGSPVLVGAAKADPVAIYNDTSFNEMAFNSAALKDEKPTAGAPTAAAPSPNTGTSSIGTASIDTSRNADPRNIFDVSYETVQEVLSQQLTEKGVGDKVSVVMNGHSNKPIFSYTRPVTIETRSLQFDKSNGHWQTNLLFLADGEVVSVLPASGHFDEMVEIAMLKHEVRNGEVIRENDLEIRDYSSTHMHADTITDLAGLLGKTPIHTISPFRPVRTSEVITPAIIKKDAIVQMRFTLPGMDISTEGQAMMDGAKGDVIPVRNINSKKIVRAVIEDSQTVNAFAIGGDHASLQ